MDEQDLERQLFDDPGAEADADVDSTESTDDASPPEDDSVDVAADDADVSDESEEGADDDEDEEDWEELRQKAAKADQLEQYLVQQQVQQNQARAAQYWAQREQTLDYQFAQAWEQVQLNAQQSLDPQTYVWEQTQALMRQYGDAQRQLRAERESAIWNAAKAQSIPNYAAQIAAQHNLTRDETQELLQYAPNQMAREAQRIKRSRSEVEQLRAELETLKRSVTAQQVAGRTVAPGGGRGVTGKVKAGSREHLRLLMGW